MQVKDPEKNVDSRRGSSSSSAANPSSHHHCHLPRRHRPHLLLTALPSARRACAVASALAALLIVGAFLFVLPCDGNSRCSSGRSSSTGPRTTHFLEEEGLYLRGEARRGREGGQVNIH